jgi:type IV secretion system protein VirB3
MTAVHDGAGEHVRGFEVPIHASLGSPILLGGAPRGLAIVNGTLAAALGLGLQLWVAGIVVWAIGHSAAVLAARRDPSFASVLARHLRQKGHLAC